MTAFFRFMMACLAGMALWPATSGAADYRRTTKSSVATKDSDRPAPRAATKSAQKIESSSGSSSVVRASNSKKSQMTAARRTAYKQEAPVVPVPDEGASGGCADGNCNGGGGGCADGSCDPMFLDGNSCCTIDGLDCCAMECKPDQIQAGGELTFLKPYFESNAAFLTASSNGLAFAQTDRQFGWVHQTAPRAWLAYACNTSGLGVRAIYWQFDNDSARETGVATNTTTLAGPFSAPDTGEFTPQTVNADDVYSAVSSLTARTLDVDGTKRTDFGLWSLTAAAGVRYAKIYQNYDGSIVDDLGDLTSVVGYNHGFEGVGPTFALQASRMVTGSLSLFSQARASILIGNGQSQLRVVENVNTTFVTPTWADSSRNDVLTVGEIQVGGEYNSAMRFGGCQLFVRGTVEAQVWQGAGNASSEDGDLVFFGGTVATGLKF